MIDSVPPRDPKKRRGNKQRNLRDLSCLLRCSLLLKALLQNWHLYFFSGARADEADDDFLMAADDAVDDMATGMLCVGCVWATSILVCGVLVLMSLPLPRSSSTSYRSMVEIVCLRERGRGV